MSIFHHRSLVAAATVLSVLAVLPQSASPVAAQSAAMGERGFVNKGLVGVGRLPADMKDKFGETLGSGSGLAVDQKTWTKSADGYSGTFYVLPDRGYNVEGTTDYRARLNKVSVKFRPIEGAATESAAAEGNAIMLKVEDTILLTDAAGEPMSGLDPSEGGVKPAAGAIPALPQTVNGRVALDPEGIVLLADGSFFISDEYGPYIYRFSPTGKMLSAIRPLDAIIPKRQGRDHFSANAPAADAKKPNPENPETGRQNNQGFEGLALAPDGKHLVTILQSATRQDGGDKPETRNYTRVFYYDITNPDQAKLVRHYVVSLPVFDNAEGKKRVAAQSELLALDDSRFLLLCRDGNGFGTKNAQSLYRKIELLDVTGATNLAGGKYDGVTPLAPGGKLEADIVPAKLTSFIDINDSAELAKFGLHNGAPNDRTNLSEKWEGLGLVPALDSANPRDFFLFVVNDNDFLTQNGFQVGAPYKGEGGVDVETMFLAYRVTLPKP
jgi:hypothetical protein